MEVILSEGHLNVALHNRVEPPDLTAAHRESVPTL